MFIYQNFLGIKIDGISNPSDRFPIPDGSKTSHRLTIHG